MSLFDRFKPLVSKISGRSPLCPWISVRPLLSPRTKGIKRPTDDICVIRSEGTMQLLRFDDLHEFWFPISMPINNELWSEYLVVNWDNELNPHYYLRNGAKVSASSIVLDCGACEGFFTRMALDSGAKLVYCIEPSPTMAECLKATFKTEIAEGRVKLLQVAVSSLSGEADFSSEDTNAFSGHFGKNNCQRVELVRIDDLINSFRPDELPNLIKMDLEGGEYEALRGASLFLKKHHPTLAVTTYHFPWDYATVHALLSGLGYLDFRISRATMRDGEVARPVLLHAF